MILKLIPSLFRVLTQPSAKFDDDVSFGLPKTDAYQVKLMCLYFVHSDL